MVQDVEELGPELQREAFVEVHILEGREVEAFESGAGNLARPTA